MPPQWLRRFVRPLMRPGVRRFPPLRRLWRDLGRRAEIEFWRNRPDLIADGSREAIYTRGFGVGRSWYREKRILDVGCGPRGSLDWAHDAAARVGLDPLADDYLQLAVDRHAMEYVSGVAEDMPFDDDSFDAITTVNALDHVDNVQRAATEMIRVLRPGGLLLLATELNHRARLTEPQTFGWEVLDLFSPPLVVLQETRLEDSGEGIDRSLADAVPYREDEPRHKGVLLAKLWAPTS